MKAPNLKIIDHFNTLINKNQCLDPPISLEETINLLYKNWQSEQDFPDEIDLDKMHLEWLDS